VDEKLIQEIKAHAAQTYPQECCGLVILQDGQPRYIPCRNTATDPAEHFRIAPEDYARAEDQGDVVGIVHSHPDATSQPSELDKAQCDVTELPWHIVSWPEGDLRTIYPRGELPLIGRPFVLGVYDCWGLIMSYFRQEHGIERHGDHAAKRAALEPRRDFAGGQHAVAPPVRPPVGAHALRGLLA